MVAASCLKYLLARFPQNCGCDSRGFATEAQQKNIGSHSFLIPCPFILKQTSKIIRIHIQEFFYYKPHLSVLGNRTRVCYANCNYKKLNHSVFSHEICIPTCWNPFYYRNQVKSCKTWEKIRLQMKRTFFQFILGGPRTKVTFQNVKGLTVQYS